MKKDVMYWNRSCTNSNKFHIFVNAVSLCGAHKILRKLWRKQDIREVRSNDEYDPEEDCKICFDLQKKYWINEIHKKIEG